MQFATLLSGGGVLTPQLGIPSIVGIPFTGYAGDGKAGPANLLTRPSLSSLSC